MYRSVPATFEAGHASAGAPALRTSWFFAEGYTGPLFEQYLLLGNPGTAAVPVRVVYLLPAGPTPPVTYVVAPRSRLTVRVNDETPAPGLSLASTAVSMVLDADAPIVAERAMWWPGSAATWREAHVSLGAEQTVHAVGRCRGRMGHRRGHIRAGREHRRHADDAAGDAAAGGPGAAAGRRVHRGRRTTQRRRAGAVSAGLRHAIRDARRELRRDSRPRPWWSSGRTTPMRPACAGAPAPRHSAPACPDGGRRTEDRGRRRRGGEERRRGKVSLRHRVLVPTSSLSRPLSSPSLSPPSSLLLLRPPSSVLRPRSWLISADEPVCPWQRICCRDVMLRATVDGLFCDAGPFHVDPAGQVDLAIVTHAHADHARPGAARYICAAPGCRRCGVASGPTRQSTAGRTATRRRSARSTCRCIRLATSSARPRCGCTTVDETWVVSGDYKRQADPTCAPFEVVPCDTFVSEATFALPIYRWPPVDEVIDDLRPGSPATARAAGRRCSLPTASARRSALLALLGDVVDEPSLVHGAVAAMVEAYREAGVTLPAGRGRARGDPRRGDARARGASPRRRP